MSAQGELELRDAPIARNTDPETSHDAAGEYSATRRCTDKDRMLQTVRAHPGKTAGEYSDILMREGMPFQKAARMPTKRLSDLLHDRKIRRAGQRKCDVTGRPASTYYPVTTNER